MSNGAAFTLLTGDGKQDTMIMAQGLLFKRLKQIETMKKQSGSADTQPTLGDIEKTHILFVNAHFKPFVPISQEYMVQKANKTSLGQDVQFSIALYGDFIHNMVVHIVLDAVSAKNTTNGDRLIRYCDYPGERILQEVSFSVNGNELDKYYSELYPFNREFMIPKNKVHGYNRMVGQQNPIDAKIQTQTGRGEQSMSGQILNGHQTPKAIQEKLDLWIPVLLWYSTDVRNAVPSVAIPFGQRFLNLKLAPVNQLLQLQGLTPTDDDPVANQITTEPNISVCEVYINNLFVHPQIHDIYVRRVGFNLIRVHRFQRQPLTTANSSNLLSNFKWPIETIYGGARPKENFSVQSSKMLDNWHQFNFSTSQSVKTGQLNSNAFGLTVALANNPAQAADYTASFATFLNGTLTGLDFAVALGVAGTTVLSVAQINTVLGRAGLPLLSGNFVNPLLPTNAEILAALPRGSLANYWSRVSALDSIKLEAHSIELYKDYPLTFYNAYKPYHYGELNNTPTDSGKFAIFFNLFPGSYQPSGHINVSRAREFYIYCTGSLISSSAECEGLFIAVAINFLLISDGSATLRYAT